MPTGFFYEYAWSDLLSAEGLDCVDGHFRSWLFKQDVEAVQQLQAYREGVSWGAKQESDFLLLMARWLAKYVAEGLAISEHVANDRLEVEGWQEDQRVAKAWQQKVRFAAKSVALSADAALWPGPVPTEKVFLQKVRLALQDQLAEDAYQDLLGFSLWLLENVPEDWSYFTPVLLKDYDNLLRLPDKDAQTVQLPLRHRREDFSLNDRQPSAQSVHKHSHYCIYCHKNQGDFCRRGFPKKKHAPVPEWKENPVGEVLSGCPLDERISEMNVLAAEGEFLAALIMVMRDNPMVALTGHRICNDCMKSCIYQKQEPVNIPAIESHVLQRVLDLPWGLEIYHLLVWWNPLRPCHYKMMAPQPSYVAVMGMGPAGMTMAQELLLRGIRVLALDGLFIRRLPETILQSPIVSFAAFAEQMLPFMPIGFGGVSEYGITVRWDKKRLLIIYLLLVRQSRFTLHGGVRFGGTVRVEDLWALGCDHLVLAVGAGLPQALPVPGSLLPGMHQANAFLMHLHLSGATHQKVRPLDVRLPAVIVGGGLTAVDTATEVQTYYIMQVKRYARWFKQLRAAEQKAFLVGLTAVEQDMSQQWLLHAEQLNTQTLQAILPSAVSIVYRQALQKAPSYRKNAEELQEALLEGVAFCANAVPKRVSADDQGQCHALQVDIQGQSQVLPAKNIFVATGAKPNVAYSYEHRDVFLREGHYYARFHWRQGKLEPACAPENNRSKEVAFLTSYQQDGRFVSLVGDAHPVFHGSVVSAIASSQKAMAVLEPLLAQSPAQVQHVPPAATLQRITHWPMGMELVIHSPLHAKHALPGHLFRLALGDAQPSTVALLRVQGHALTFFVTEPMPEQGEVYLMGPTGVRMAIPDTPSRVLLLTDESGVLDSISLFLALKAAGHHVDWFHFDQVQPWQGFWQHWGVEVQAATWAEFQQQSPKRADRILVMAKAELVRQVSQWRAQVPCVASVKGPLQCALKGICAQCLQWQINPETLERSKAVFACSWQNEPIELIDMQHLAQRQSGSALNAKMQAFQQKKQPCSAVF